MAKRSIFQEVGGDAPSERPVAIPGGLSRERGSRGAVRAWLLALFALVTLMIAVGGLTRLTDSGLSITEWAPVTGAIPPLSAQAWEAEFEAYRAIPEYRLQNRGMSMAEFQVIYWWEWGHRALGRVIGLVWALGFVFLAATKRVPPGWNGRLLLLGALGGLQGAIGWWMVSSGLREGMLDVASYRLAVHLGLAFVILGVIAWFALLLGRPEAELIRARRGREDKLFRMTTGLMHFTLLQVVLGALVAGIDAGRTYTDWPLMAGGILPPDPFGLSPWWRNFFEDPGLVQFVHRVSAYALAAFAVVVWLRGRRSPVASTRTAYDLVMGMTVVQLVLGVVTVVTVAPWWWAISHQFGAVVLWVLVIRARFLAGHPLPQSVRAAA
jgi:cytochrome c oxidase assembly protein subunit 15